uniref:Uncharacterized protein n=1 Tax=Strigamia maritima TaxID=126957 RepID=T1IXI4_STRMM
MKYRGHFTFIDLAWKDVETFYSFTKPFGDNLIFYLHSDTFEHAHDDFRIHAEEFKNLNLRRNPCAPAEQVVKCVNDCINQVLLKRLNCGLPFVNSTLPKCTTLYQTMENYAHIIFTFFELAITFEILSM